MTIPYILYGNNGSLDPSTHEHTHTLSWDRHELRYYTPKNEDFGPKDMKVWKMIDMIVLFKQVISAGEPCWFFQGVSNDFVAWCLFVCFSEVFREGGIVRRAEGIYYNHSYHYRSMGLVYLPIHEQLKLCGKCRWILYHIPSCKLT